MKRILITAAGTAIAWHICQICEEYFKEQIEVYLCDINEPFLVPASTIAKKAFKVPYAYDSAYISEIEKIVINNKIDYIIPLLPTESLQLGKDSDVIKTLGIQSASCLGDVFKKLSDKLLMHQTLSNLKIETPKLFTIEEIVDNERYFVKPRLGFGSLNTEIMIGRQIKDKNISSDYVIQELCQTDNEVTVEVFNGQSIKVFARRRVETKSGVCVKMIPIDNTVFIPIVNKLVANLCLPIAFNLQFFYDENKWKLFDCNLRLGAGTALATAAGFQLTRAFVAELINEPIKDEWFVVDKEIKSVLRVYKEVIVR